MILTKLLKNKFGFFAFLVLSFLYLAVIFAPFFVPYRYDEEDAFYSYAPPAKIHFFSQNKSTPFVYGSDYKINEYYQRVYEENKNKVLPIRFFVKGFKYKLLGFFEVDRHLFGVEGGKIYLLGADLKGRDIFSRILYGGRISLSIGLIGALISLSIGLIIGGISGYFGGKIDNFIMRVCEMIMMVPSFYLMLALRASFPPNLTSSQVYLLIIIIMSFIGWASTARIIRGMAISLRENDFVYAARTLGLGNFKIIIRHILPHTLSYALVAVVLSIPSYILGEAALSLIGLGIQEPQASWGNLLSSAMGIINIRLFPWILTPGLFIIITVIAFNILGDTLRDILDPKRKIL
ncbi:MAG: ABC transporter permease [Candidatus Omnitrophica bacterium]|jgi:peptide/nickel transport system permease protein|nr:ABC transporter permease [Candidatus Omnitrophota bacterium]